MSIAKSLSLAVLLIVIVAVMLWFIPLETDIPQDGVGGDDMPRGSLSVIHSYADGVHTYSGGIAKPTPCHILTSDITIDDSSVSPFVTLDFSLKDSGEICIQVISEEQFSLSIRGPETVNVAAYINGEPHSLTIEEL